MVADDPNSTIDRNTVFKKLSALRSKLGTRIINKNYTVISKDRLLIKS